MKSNMIYLKAEQSTKVNSKNVEIQDIATVFCADSGILQAIQKLKVFQVPKDVQKEKKYPFSILYIIEIIQQKFPEVEIYNIGAAELVICYVPPKKKNKFLDYSKVVIVCLLIFFGSAFTIMTFNEDASLREIFKLLYKIADKDLLEKRKLLEISYSVGIPIGTIVFFNHFSRFKMDDDPTPLQVQMRLYEGDEMTTIIENSSREKRIVNSIQEMKEKPKEQGEESQKNN